MFCSVLFSFVDWVFVMCLSLNRNVFIPTIGIYVIFKLYYVTGICSSCKIQVSNKVKGRKKDLRYKVF